MVPRTLADPAHVRLLEGGPKAIQEWIRERRNPTLDLRGADLGGHDFEGLDVGVSYYEPGSNAEDFGFYFGRRIDFTRATLSRSNFHSANLLGAKMVDAKLDGAILDRANLTYADLSGADLSGASLRRAVLEGTKLNGATLEQATFGGTIFSGASLSGARGLEHCVHRSSSTVDIQTLLNSGALPENFLRGCGLPEDLITFLPSLLEADPIQFYSCFISYSTLDQEFADRLFSDLQRHGIRCWFAPEHMRIGEKVRAGIDEAIRSYDKLLLILSENSVHSDWVGREVERALEKEKQTARPVLFPIRLDDAIVATRVDWAADVRAIQIGDFRNWGDQSSYRRAFGRLLRDLKQGKR